MSGTIAMHDMRILSVDPVPFHQLPYVVGSSTAATLPFLDGRVESLPDGLDAILATGDLQGVVQDENGERSPMLLGEALATEIRLLQLTGALPPKEKLAIVLTGDLQPSADMDDVRGVWKALGARCRWVAGVAGNHDAFGLGNAQGPADFEQSNLHFFDDRIERVGSLLIGGISGIIGNMREPWVRTEAEFTAAVGRLACQAPALLLMHDGPNVAGSMLAGWPSVRQVLEAASPCLVCRGHDPWPKPLATLSNGTQVLNVEGRVLVLRQRPLEKHLGSVDSVRI